MNNSTTRLETFSDGVFAIAITLLILEIKVPPHDTITSNHSLLHAITGHWTSWLAFIISFFNLTISWVNHHNAFKLICKTSPLFNFVNGFFLLTIAIIPYPTSLLAEYINTDSAHTAVMIYCLSITLHSVAWILIFNSMIFPKDLTKDEHARKEVLKQRSNCVFGSFLYLGICTLAYWFPWIALFMMIALYFFWIYVAITTKVQAE
jgi:uncharacterized membrane protein